MYSQNQDLTNGDHSFKNFLKVMWQNNYIQLIIVALAIGGVITWGRDAFVEWWHFYFLMSIPVAMIIIIVAKGLQYWDDLKNGRTR